MTSEKKDKSKPPPRKQHIVPKSHLRRFASEDMLWVLDFHNRSQRETSILNAAKIRDFYTIQTPDRDKDYCIEDGLNKFGETQASPLIDEILDRHRFPQDENWVKFIIFVAMMYVRGPWLRQIIAERVNNSCAETMEELHASPEAYRRSPMGQFSYQRSLEIYNDIKDEMFPAISRNFYVNFMLRCVKDCYAVFLRMTPNLIYVEPQVGSIFVTSDRPVVAMSTKAGGRLNGLVNPDIDVYFPLSSRAYLILNHDGLPKVWGVDRRRLAYANYVQARNCSRLVMSQHTEFSWMRENRTISVSPVEIISTFADQKKDLPLVREYGGKESLSRCLNDWSILRGRD